MLLLLNPAKDLLSVSQLVVTGDPGTIQIISEMILGIVPQQT
jgi:hypothetical protein